MLSREGTATLDQRDQALELANDVRCHNAWWKTQTASLPAREGLQRVLGVLSEPCPPLDAVPVESLLRSVHRVGEEKAWRLLDQAGVRSGRRRVRELTVRQRLVLVGELEALLGRWSG